MKATWPKGNFESSFRIWFLKLAEEKNGKLVPLAVNGCLNTISDDWNEVIYDDMRDIQLSEENYDLRPCLVFAKEPNGGPYIFRGVFERNLEKSKPKHHVHSRIGTKVRLIGQPANRFGSLEDFRKR